MDQYLLHLLNQSAANPLLDLLMSFISFGILIFLPALVIYHYRKEQLPFAKALATAILLGLGFSLLFQFLALRPRPEDVRLIWPSPDFPSFPSGHASITFAVAMVYCLCRRYQWQWLLLATMVGLSRVYLGHHYPTDILAGSYLGLACGAAAYGLFLENRSDKPGWRWFLWIQVAIVFLVSQMAYMNYLPWHLIRWQHADKISHFVLFGAVVFWLNVWLDGKLVRLFGLALPLAIVLPFSFAIVEEGIQGLAPNRTASYEDLAADLSGMLFFWIISHFLLKRWRRKHLNVNMQSG